jgi:hypothetical protein
MKIESRIQSYFGELENDKHHRYRSWEHCYQFFQSSDSSELRKHPELGALQLGFYLASWGMYRGRSFLLQRAYTAHIGAVICLTDHKWSTLWKTEFGANADDQERVNQVVSLAYGLRESYAEFGTPTDILVTKIMLGTIGCTPACGRYFIAGFKSEEGSYSYFNQRFMTQVLGFCRNNLTKLRRSQTMIAKSVGTRYPLMKLIDMYFFQGGLDRAAHADDEVL